MRKAGGICKGHVHREHYGKHVRLGWRNTAYVPQSQSKTLLTMVHKEAKNSTKAPALIAAGGHAHVQLEVLPFLPT